MSEIINKVADSGIITIDLEEFYQEGERVVLDIKPLLFQELILKESDFREFIKNENWKKYKSKLVAIHCSADAIVPRWAYMLLAIALEPFAKKIIYGTLEQLEIALFEEALSKLDFTVYKDARVVIKGCGSKQVPIQTNIRLAVALKPYVKSMMYGEPCSTVPLYKVKKDQ